MRVKPTALTAIVAILGYMVVVFTVWAATALKYDTVGDTVENVQKGVVLSMVLGTVYLAVVTTALGWWRPAIREPRKVGSGWMWLIPVFLLIGTIANLATTMWGEIDGVATYAAWLAFGCVLVGFNEELLTRGLAIVGGRGSMHEKWVWVFSGGIFAVLHAPNALFGQSVGGTVFQMVFAFAIGTSYYVTRRIAGTLIVTMVLHGLWDFSVFIQGRSTKFLAEPPVSVGGFVLYIVFVLTIVAVVKVIKNGDVVEPGGDQLAELAEAA